MAVLPLCYYTTFSKCVTHYDTFTDTLCKDISGLSEGQRHSPKRASYYISQDRCLSMLFQKFLNISWRKWEYYIVWA